MKYLDEFRDPELAKRLLEKIHAITTKHWGIMEICGGQTHSIIRNGIDQLLPDSVEMIHGPGCPVCVTPLEIIDKALEIARQPNVIFTSFGDMLRVPGSNVDLQTLRSQGADVRMVYSPLESLKIARENPDREVVFLAIGFETTAPGNAMAILQAKREGLTNYSELISQVRVPPAMEAILSAEDNRVHGFLAAGHVCAVMGWGEYEAVAAKYRTPIVVTGFEPLDILEGLYRVILQLETGRHEVENAYKRAVTREGSGGAKKALDDVFMPADQTWRGIGEIPESGLVLRPEFSAFDANLKFSVGNIITRESPLCIAGLILQGKKKPAECPAFGKECSPRTPLGATMVSDEGTCAAYFRHKRLTV